jgi:hypothetical protein
MVTMTADMYNWKLYYACCHTLPGQHLDTILFRSTGPSAGGFNSFHRLTGMVMSLANSWHASPHISKVDAPDHAV